MQEDVEKPARQSTVSFEHFKARMSEEEEEASEEEASEASEEEASEEEEGFFEMRAKEKEGESKFSGDGLKLLVYEALG